MDNNALMAALGMDAVAAIRGYCSAVVADAARRGLRLGAGSFSGPVRSRVADPLDIRLTVHDTDRSELAGRALGWSAASGWWLRCHGPRDRVWFYAGRTAHPLHLVPTPPAVVDWATAGPGVLTRHADSPTGVDLEDDPAALHRLIAFLDPHRRLHAGRAVRTPRTVASLGPPSLW